MNAPPIPMPPFEVLAEALRRITEHLAREFAHPTDSNPDWGETDWAIARSVAAMQGISVLLANNLRWSGPPAWQAFLAEQRVQCLLRHERIGALLERIDAAVRERRIGCVALKGSALRALGIYRPAERPMADVDLLVAPEDLPRTAAAVADLGYVEAGSSQRHRIFEPRQKHVLRLAGEHADNPLRIELHTTVTEELPVRSVDITGRVQRSAIKPGVNTYADLVSLLLHLLLHAAGNMRSHSLRQIQLHDIAAVAALLKQDDWQRLLERPNREEGPWWMFPPLWLAARYYPEHVPSGAVSAARAACPRLLRRAAERQSLTHVSWSNLRIHAFPGIEWSRTPLEAARFIRSRVLPSRRSLGELDVLLETNPEFGAVPWYGVSHASRIFRWLFSHPPRVQTMVSVSAALRDGRS